MFKIDDTVVAFDFKPTEDRDDRYVVGVIKEVKKYTYVLEVLIDETFKKNPRKGVVCPKQLDVELGDFANRILAWKDYEKTYYLNYYA
jgi:hypothetical protein